MLLRESVSKCSLEVTYRSWKVGTDIVLWTIKGYPGCKFNTKDGKICVANQGKYKGNASLCVGFSNRSPANCLVLVHSTDKSALTFFQNDSEARKHYEATKYPTGLLRISNPKQYAGYYIGAAYEVVDKKVICSTGLRLEKDAAKAIRIVQDGPARSDFRILKDCAEKQVLVARRVPSQVVFYSCKEWHDYVGAKYWRCVFLFNLLSRVTNSNLHTIQLHQ